MTTQPAKSDAKTDAAAQFAAAVSDAKTTQSKTKRRSSSKSSRSSKSKSTSKKTTKTKVKTGAQKVFDHAITAVIRRLGKEGLSFKGIKAALKAAGAKVGGTTGVKESTIRTQMTAGRNGQRGEPAKLARDQLKKCKAAAKKAEATTDE
jgi:hypothetical protein